MKNFDRLTNLVQVVLNMGMELVRFLPLVLAKKLAARSDDAQQRSVSQSTAEEENNLPSQEGEEDGEDAVMDNEEDSAALALWEEWSIDELKRLLDFTTSLFLSNFAVYMAYKVLTAHNMEVKNFNHRRGIIV